MGGHFAHSDAAVMASHANIAGLIVGKRNNHRCPLAGIMTGFAGICGDGVRGTFIAGAVTTAGDTSADNGLVVTERNDRRDPSAGVMTSVTVVTGLRVRGRFATDAVA